MEVVAFKHNGASMFIGENNWFQSRSGSGERGRERDGENFRAIYTGDFPTVRLCKETSTPFVVRETSEILREFYLLEFARKCFHPQMSYLQNTPF